MTLGDIGYSRKPGEAIDPSKVPLASQDAPALGPKFDPSHRWVYCPDMTPSEAVIFKQYDFRPSGQTRAAYHHSMEDKFHDCWKECPGRRSIECRILLTFDDNAPPPSESPASKL